MSKRKREVEEPEVAKSPLVDAGEVEGPSKRMRFVDPITKADRRRWVEYFVRMSRGTEKTQESLLRDFVFEVRKKNTTNFFIGLAAQSLTLDNFTARKRSQLDLQSMGCVPQQ